MACFPCSCKLDLSICIGRTEATDTNVYGISVSFYCGSKKSFKDDGSGPSSGPLLQCLKDWLFNPMRIAFGSIKLQTLRLETSDSEGL